MKKRSFFERLTGSVNLDDEDIQKGDDAIDDDGDFDSRITTVGGRAGRRSVTPQAQSTWAEEPTGEGELSVDVYQTPDEVIVRAMIPGVKKDDVDISISRDSIVIKGARKEERTIADQDYVVRELYWGAFSRTVRLPHEVDIEHAEAYENQGLLTIKLPRVDKDRQAKLRIKSI